MTSSGSNLRRKASRNHSHEVVDLPGFALPMIETAFAHEDGFVSLWVRLAIEEGMTPESRKRCTQGGGCVQLLTHIA